MAQGGLVPSLTAKRVSQLLLNLYFRGSQGINEISLQTKSLPTGSTETSTMSSVLVLPAPMSEVSAAGLQRGIVMSALPTTCISHGSQTQRLLLQILPSIFGISSLEKKGEDMEKPGTQRLFYRGANENLFGVIDKKASMVVKRAAKATFTVNTGITESGGPSGDMFFTDLDAKVGSSSSAKTTLSRGFAGIGDKNAFKGAVVHCVPFE